MARTNKMKLPRGIYLTGRWRADGQIVYRWGMAPGLRKQGIRAIDLKDAAGTPLPRDAAIARARELTAALKAGTPAPPPIVKPSGRTIGDLLDAYLHPSNLHTIRNRQTGEPLAESTRGAYRRWRPPIDEVFQTQPIALMTPALVQEWFDLVRDTRGHHMATCSYNLLKIVWRWGGLDWGCGPFDWQKIIAPAPPRKLRIGGLEELGCLLTAMDNPGELYARLADRGEAVAAIDQISARPELGDALVIAIWTTQREADVLRMSVDSFANGRVYWIATKNKSNGRRLNMPQLGPLPARIAAARKRREARGITCPTIVVSPTSDAPYSINTLGRHFREARALAARFHPSLLGIGVDPWNRPYKRFTFEDCRDTGITRLANAGCDLLEICSWSNHANPRSLMDLFDSYIELSGQTADRAGDKLGDWWKKTGGLI